jgi:CDP-diglyceride synthetase
MFKFIKDYFSKMFILFFTFFYISYFVTVIYFCVKAHYYLIKGQNFKEVSFGILTFIIFGFLPILLWRMTSKSEFPILKETNGLRYVMSWIAMVFTICIFISKSIFNSVARSIVNWNNNIIFDEKGRIVLVEVLSVGIPLIIFLYLSKKVVSHFLKEDKE